MEKRYRCNPKKPIFSSWRINHYFSKSESEFENKLQRWYSWKTGERSKQRVLAKKKALFKAIVDLDGGEYSMSHFVERLKANDKVSKNKN